MSKKVTYEGKYGYSTVLGQSFQQGAKTATTDEIADACAKLPDFKVEGGERSGAFGSKKKKAKSEPEAKESDSPNLGD